MIPRAKHIATAVNAHTADAADWVFDKPFRLLKLVVGNWAACSLLYSLFEWKSPIEGGWWGLVTGSTVGYGDQYPFTFAGRVVAAWLIVSSVVGLALLTGQIASWCNRDAWTHIEQENLKRDVAAARAAAEQAVAEVQALRAEITSLRELLATGVAR